MDSLLTNTGTVYKCIKNHIKTSFINLNLKSKWYNRGEHLTAVIECGCVRSSQKNTSFIPTELQDCLNDIEKSLGSWEMKSHEVITLNDNKSKHSFELLRITLVPLDID
jgi:hypothetical protein